MNKYFEKTAGFTLIEIMVSLVISSLVIAGVYGVYTIQQRSYTVQEQVSEMQQRLRSALDFMTRHIRMAGYDPENNCGQSALMISRAEKNIMIFDTCDPEEDDFYRTTIQFDNDTETVYLTRDAGRNDDASSMPLAEGVDAFEISYLKKDDTEMDGYKEVTKEANDNTEINAVRIAMLLRASYQDPKYTNTTQYQITPTESVGPLTPTESVGPFNDHYHRRLLVTTIYLRNIIGKPQ
jgi:type IV pilus assembly protein PilW